MKPNKIVKQQTNLLAPGQAHLTGSFFFPSPFELSLFTIYHELKKNKNQKLVLKNEDVHIFKIC